MHVTCFRLSGSLVSYHQSEGKHMKGSNREYEIALLKALHARNSDSSSAQIEFR